MKKYLYVDTCVWLNLFKKEQGYSGTSYSDIAKKLFLNIENSHASLLVSTIVVKEISFKVGTPYSVQLNRMRRVCPFSLISTTPLDYSTARDIERTHSYLIGFYDCLHIVLAKKFDAILVTRDKALLEIAKKYVLALKPEELF